MTSCQGCAILLMVWVCGSQRIKSWGSLRHDPNVQFDRTVLSTCDSSRPFHHHPCLEKEKSMVSGCLTTVNQCKLPLYNNIPAFGVGSKSGTILSAESWQSTNQIPVWPPEILHPNSTGCDSRHPVDCGGLRPKNSSWRQLAWYQRGPDQSEPGNTGGSLCWDVTIKHCKSLENFGALTLWAYCSELRNTLHPHQRNTAKAAAAWLTKSLRRALALGGLPLATFMPWTCNMVYVCICMHTQLIYQIVPGRAVAEVSNNWRRWPIRIVVGWKRS